MSGILAHRTPDRVAALRASLVAAAADARRLNAMHDARATATGTRGVQDDVWARLAPARPSAIWAQVAALVAEGANGCAALERLCAADRRFEALSREWAFWQEACSRHFPAPPHPKTFADDEATQAGRNARHTYWRRRFEAWCRGKALVDGDGPNGIRTAVGLLTDSGEDVPDDHFAGEDLENWYVEDVTDMHELFLDKRRFDADLNAWDTSNVVTMRRMFDECYWYTNEGATIEFNTSRVTDMSDMFGDTYRLNVELVLDTAAVTNMSGMFSGSLFDNAGRTLVMDTAAVTDMSRMFATSAFTQAIAFDTAIVRDMSHMFDGAVLYNNGGQPLVLNTRSVIDFSRMFAFCHAFNQPLAWDVRNGQRFDAMFWEARRFAQPLNAWQVDPQAQTQGMFHDTDLQRNDQLPPWYQG